MGIKVGVRDGRQTTGRAGICGGAYEEADYKLAESPHRDNEALTPVLVNRTLLV